MKSVYHCQKTTASLLTLKHMRDWLWVSDDVRNISDAVNQFKTARKKKCTWHLPAFVYFTKTKKNANQAEVFSFISLMNFLQSTVHATAYFA